MERIGRRVELQPEGGAVIPAMREAFPQELTKIAEGFADKLAKGERPPEFPTTEITALVVANGPALAHAPDDYLLAYAKASEANAEFFTAEECALTVKDEAKPATRESRVASAPMQAAMILAEGAGIKQPTRRAIKDEDVANLQAEFQQQLPEKLRLALQGTPTRQDQCELAGAYMKWLGALPANKLVVALKPQSSGR